MGKILLVDDEKIILESYEGILTSHGHEVILAHDGYEAIDLYREKIPDLVIMDVLMPRMDGVEAIELLKQEFPDARIIAMSGGFMNQKEFFLDEARNRGAVETIAKPFRPEELLQIIDKLLDEQKSDKC